MRTFPRLFVALVVGAVLAGCGADASGGAAATVNGTDISRDLLEDLVVGIMEDAPDMTGDDRQAQVASMQSEMLTYLIQDVIYADLLESEGVDLTDEELAEARAEQVEELGGEDAYEAELASYGVPMELFELIIRFEARNSALQQHVFEGEQARAVRHILVETEDEALDTIAELEDGADFGELAAERSQDPGSAQNGGAYPPAPRGSWVEEFEQAVWDADLNETLGPVETVHGFHVIEVTDETELDPAELDPQLLQQMTQPAMNELLQPAFEQAEVDVAGGFGEWDAATGRVVPDEGEVGRAPDSPDLGEPAEPVEPLPGE